MSIVLFMQVLTSIDSYHNFTVTTGHVGKAQGFMSGLVLDRFQRMERTNSCISKKKNTTDMHACITVLHITGIPYHIRPRPVGYKSHRSPFVLTHTPRQNTESNHRTTCICIQKYTNVNQYTNVPSSICTQSKSKN